MLKFRFAPNLTKYLSNTGTLAAGLSFTMKGSGVGDFVFDVQNYVFSGKPNNATISTPITSGNNALVGAYAEDNGNGVDAGSAYMFEWTNQPPNTPSITGKIKGEAGVEYDYTFNTTDPDGDDVYYWVTWGDSCPAVEWDGPYNSGETIIISHTYEEQGVYAPRDQRDDSGQAQTRCGILSG